MDEPSPQRLAEAIQLIEIVARFEIRVLLGRDQQRRTRQVDLTLVTRDQSAQGASRFGGVWQCLCPGGRALARTHGATSRGSAAGAASRTRATGSKAAGSRRAAAERRRIAVEATVGGFLIAAHSQEIAAERLPGPIASGTERHAN